MSHLIFNLKNALVCDQVYMLVHIKPLKKTHHLQVEAVK